jgi:hypothetical protein
MSAKTASLLLDFLDPLKAAVDLVKSERLITQLACARNPSLSRKAIMNRNAIKRFQREMWQRDEMSRVLDEYLELAAALPPPSMIYVETADGKRAEFAGERLLDDARLVGVPCNLVLRIEGRDYSVVDVSRSPLLDNSIIGVPNLGSGVQEPPSPSVLVFNPAFVRWREMATHWQQERFKRLQEFLAACDMLRRDTASFEINIEADSTVVPHEQTEPIDGGANRPGMTGVSAPPTAVTSYLATRKKISGRERVRAPYLVWLREQSQPPSYNKRLDKLKELALAADWPAPSGPAESTLREWEMNLRQEFLRETT